MGNAIEIPDYLKSVVSTAAEDMQVSSGSSLPRILLGKKRFTFKKGKDEVKVEKKPIDVVILGANPPGRLMAKAYYAVKYDPENPLPPDCHSSDGVKPDASVENPISKRCFDCKFNAFKSADNGKGKACADSKQLAVVEASNIDGDIYIVSVPATSLKNLGEYTDKMVKKGAPIEAAVTRLSFNDDEVYPILQFDFLAFLNSETAPKTIERSKKKEWAEGNFDLSAVAIEDKSVAVAAIEAPKPAAKSDDDELLSQWPE